jgi:hypothetical protein
MTTELNFQVEPFQLSPATKWGVKSSCCRSPARIAFAGAEAADAFENLLEEGPLVFKAVSNPRLEVISRFSRYATSVTALPATERGKIDRMAAFIANALRSGRESIRTIRLTGHADMGTLRRPAFEHKVARARAHEILEAPWQALGRVERQSGGASPPYSERVAWEVRSAGATRLAVPKPRTELDRSRNRRVEIALLPYAGQAQPAAKIVRTTLTLAPRQTADVGASAAIDEFLRRAPEDALRYNDPDFGRDLADRRICVSALATKAAQLCQATKPRERGGIPCQGVLTLNPATGGRCFSRIVGSQILAGKDYRAPLTGKTRTDCCTRLSPCAAKTLDSLPNGQYLVLQYQAAPLKKMVERLKCLIDRGCVVPVGILSGICDDKADLSGIYQPVPLQNKWCDCWEHWLLIIGYDGDRFVFWDSAGASMIGPLRAGKDFHHFGFLYYDPVNHRLSTATTNPAVANTLEVDSSGFSHARSASRTRAKALSSGLDVERAAVESDPQFMRPGVAPASWRYRSRNPSP